MKEEKQKEFYEKYPKIFVQKDLPMTQTCLCWGLSISSGWTNILDNLCNDIQKYCDEHEDKNFQIEAVQVKEKFGRLMFYSNFGDDYIFNLIDEAEELSAKTCEYCGEDGVPRTGGWIKTLCDNCNEKFQNGYRQWREE